MKQRKNKKLIFLGFFNCLSLISCSLNIADNKDLYEFSKIDVEKTKVVFFMDDSQKKREHVSTFIAIKNDSGTVIVKERIDISYYHKYRIKQKEFSMELFSSTHIGNYLIFEYFYEYIVVINLHSYKIYTIKLKDPGLAIGMYCFNGSIYLLYDKSEFPLKIINLDTSSIATYNIRLRVNSICKKNNILYGVDYLTNKAYSIIGSKIVQVESNKYTPHCIKLKTKTNSIKFMKP